MTKVTLNNVADLTQATTAVVTINSNSNTIETAFDNTLSRDGTAPNSMRSNLDMDSNRILNLPEPLTAEEPLRLQDLVDFTGGSLIIPVIPTGGTSGQVLAKTSGVDYATAWTNDSALVNAGSNIAITGTNPATIGVVTSPAWTGATLTNPVINGEVTGTAVDTLSTANTLVKRTASGGIVGIPTGYTTTATAAGTTTLTVNSTYDQYFTGVTTQTVVLPVTSTLALGSAYRIVNNSTGAITVNSSGGNLVSVVPGGGRALFTCILTSGTTAASWSATPNYTNVASGKLLSSSNTLTLAGTDGTTMTFPTTSATVARTDASNTFTGAQTFSNTINKVTVTAPTTSAVLTLADTKTLTTTTGATITGSTDAAIVFDNIPQNSQSTAYGLVLGDAQKHILHPTADNNPRTFTIPANSSVAYPIGTAITFVNQINTLTIAITTDTLTLAGAGTTGSRTLAANGIATAIKLTSTGWLISGTGLT